MHIHENFKDFGVLKIVVLKFVYYCYHSFNWNFCYPMWAGRVHAHPTLGLDTTASTPWWTWTCPRPTPRWVCKRSCPPPCWPCTHPRPTSRWLWTRPCPPPCWPCMHSCPTPCWVWTGPRPRPTPRWAGRDHIHLYVGHECFYAQPQNILLFIINKFERKYYY